MPLHGKPREEDRFSPPIPGCGRTAATDNLLAGRNLPVPLHHSAHDHCHQPFDEVPTEANVIGDTHHSIQLASLSLIIDRRQRLFGFQVADMLGTAKAFGQNIEESGIQIVDGPPVGSELLCHIICHHLNIFQVVS